MRCGLARLDPSTRRVDGFHDHHVYGYGDVGINKWPPQPTTTPTPYIRSTLCIRPIPHTTRVRWRGLRLRAPTFPSCHHHHHTPSLCQGTLLFPSFFRERKCTLTISINSFSIPWPFFFFGYLSYQECFPLCFYGFFFSWLGEWG